MNKIIKSLFALTLCACACTMFACKDNNQDKQNKDTYEPITIVNVDYNNDNAMRNGSHNLYLSDNNNYTFNFELEPEEASWKDFDITISNKDVIELNEKTVKGKSVGSSIVTFKAKKGDFEKSVTFNVSNPDFYSYGTYYSFDELATRLKNGNDIKLLKDVVAESGMFTFSKTVTIDLNGHNINMKGNTITLESGDAVVTFSNYTGNESKIYGTSTLLYAKCNRVVASNINFETTSATAYAIKNLNNMELNNCVVKGYNGIESSSNLTISNTTIEVQNYGLVVDTTNQGTNVNFTSNSKIVSNNQGVLAKNNANFEMESGSISAKNEAVLCEGTGANVVLKAGAITSNSKASMLVNGLGDCYISCYPNGNNDVSTGRLTLSGKPAIKVLQGNVKVGEPTIADSKNQVEVLTNSVAGDLSFKFLTNNSLTAKVTTAMNDDKSDVKVSQNVNIDKTYGNFVFEDLKLKFASTEFTLNGNGQVVIRPITPIYFDGKFVYEFDNNDNFQFKTLDEKVITPTSVDIQGAKNSKIELTDDNGFILTWSGAGTENIPETIEIFANYLSKDGENTQIVLTIHINISTE